MSHGPPPSSFLFQSALCMATSFTAHDSKLTQGPVGVTQQELAGGRRGLYLIHLIYKVHDPW